MHILVYDAQNSHEVEKPDWAALLANTKETIWLDITGPGEDDLAWMRDVMKFHPLAIEDTSNQHQRPKVEEYANHLFAILNPVLLENDELKFRELDVFVGSNYVVTVHPKAEPVVDEARQRVKHHQVSTPISSGYLLYVLLDIVVDGYFPVLDAIGVEIETLEEGILNNPQQSALNRLFHMKRTLAELWRVVSHQRDMFNVLSHRDLTYIGIEAFQYHLRDVYDHLLRITDMTATYRDLLTSMIDLYMSSVSNRLNRVVNRLTVVTIVIGAMAVITGFYGMNFEHTWPPFQAPWGIPFVILLLALIITFILFIFRRLGWY